MNTDAIRIGGYRPGALGRVAELHADYYHRNWGFGLVFEAQVATELAAFLSRFDPARDGFWLAEAGDRIVGSVSIDGQLAASEGARLRWFILADEARGQGVGTRLLDGALRFCREAGYPSIYLWTFAGLEAAGHLYRKAGFRLEATQEGNEWGCTVHDQKYRLELRGPGPDRPAPSDHAIRGKDRS